MKKKVLGILAGIALAATACGGAAKQTTGRTFAATMEDAPDWTRKGCAAFSGEKRKWVCGVGSMEGTNNLSLCRTTAMARGRTEIARELNLRVKAMVKDYQRSVTGGGAMHVAADDEQYAADVAKQITDISLSGTHLEDTWFSEDGHCFALMVLDVDGFRDAVAGAAGLDKSVRDYVVRNAEKAFQELDAATAPAQ